MKQRLVQLPLRLDGVAALTGDEAALRILFALESGELRYSEFGLQVSSKTLAARLRTLERHGLVSRTYHAEVPPRVVYALTPKGAEFLTFVKGLLQWEQSW